MKKSKIIIFDLGGVILNINYQNTINSFKSLGMLNPNLFYSKNNQSEIFNLIETGKISSKKFLSELQKNTKKGTIEDIKDSWNAMLLDLPPGRLNLLNNLRNTHKLFLLSNTNDIHINALISNLGRKKWEYFCSLFNKIYFSHEIKVKKPDLKAFELILNEQKIEPKDILFIDDTYQHIKSAQKLGINCHHLKETEDITTLFLDKAQSILH